MHFEGKMSCVYGSDYCEECPVIKFMLDIEGDLDLNALGRFCQACPYLKIPKVDFEIKQRWKRENEENKEKPNLM